MLRLRNEKRVFQFQVIRDDEIPPLIMISARRPSPDPKIPRSRGVISKASRGFARSIAQTYTPPASVSRNCSLRFLRLRFPVLRHVAPSHRQKARKVG